MTKLEEQFVTQVYSHYYTAGRHQLPWRQTTDPYHILLSELMLQQTQVSRVVPKYQSFINQFPDIQTLAKAPLGVVLQNWQGLGYNRRAKMLHECAQIVANEYSGLLPDNRVTLESLPGIGPYTAGAVLAFAFNQPVVMIETNIRTVFLHHFFADKSAVPDSQLLPFIERTLDTAQPRTWYAALMDYGSYLKQTVGNNIRQSRHYQKQSTFKGSVREVRGAILRELSKQPYLEEKLLRKALVHFADDRFSVALAGLINEGLLVESKNSISLPGINQPNSSKDTSCNNKG